MDRRMKLEWGVMKQWVPGDVYGGEFSSRIYPRRENVAVHLDYVPQQDTEE